MSENSVALNERVEGAESPSSGSGIKLVAGLAVLALIVFLAVKLNLKESFQVFLGWIRDLGPAGPAILVGAYILSCVLFLPGSILTLGAGFLFGLPGGTLAVSIGSTLGCIAAFLVGRFIARSWVETKIQANPRLRALDEAVANEGFKIVFLTRLSPLFPFNLLNFFYGVTRVSLKDYALASWIGMLPGTVMFVYFGTIARSLTDLAVGTSSGGMGSQIMKVVGLVATIAVTAKITKIARAGLETALEQSDGTAVPDSSESAPHEPVDVSPMDEHNQTLVDHVKPSDWTNPAPAPVYNMVVIGGGPAGLVTAAAAAGLGAKVALIEKHLLGGDCLNVGCVPSKALIRAARVASEVRNASAFGVHTGGDVTVDFPAVMERMRRLRAGISHHDSAERFTSLGIDVFQGAGRFTGKNTVEVDGKTLRFRKACIATGGRARAIPVPGLKEAGFLTNESVFNLTELPRDLAVIGAGPIGSELAQSFARFGSRVHLINQQPQILAREDRAAAAVVEKAFVEEGIELYLGAKSQRVGVEDGRRKIELEHDGETRTLVVDQILVSAGRTPNVEGLGLEAAGISYDPHKGVRVDDFLRTTNPNVFGAGDVASRYQFTHAADFLARLVIRNALFMGRGRASALTIPWCTYTDPEIAHVGMYEHEAKAAGIPVTVHVQQMAEVDRAIVDGDTEGFAKVIVKEGTDQILGATLVSSHAGDMIGEISVAMAAGMGLGKIANVIHPYPTTAEAIRKLGDAHNRTRLTPFVKGLFQKWLGWSLGSP